MSRGQKFGLALGCVLLALLGLFPPWNESITAPTGYHQERPLGYGFLLSPPQPFDRDYSVTLDFSRLVTSWATVAFVTGGIVVLLHQRPQKDQP